VNVKIYVEGGGDSKEQHARCREGFSKLIEKAGFRGRMPRIIAGGGRESTYDRFKTATAAGAQAAYPMLLVDSEDPVPEEETVPDSALAWVHLKSRDNWDRPAGVKNDQAQLMVTCMETWIMVDREALRTRPLGRAFEQTPFCPRMTWKRGHGKTCITRLRMRPGIAAGERHIVRGHDPSKFWPNWTRRRSTNICPTSGDLL
jgi:hypothetical protein